jgi:magnesium-dependent phosphatase 1
MYQLSSGSPFTQVEGGQKTLLTRDGSKVNLLGISGFLLDELRSNPVWRNTKIAWVSTTDEPSWAKECLKKFVTSPNRIPIASCADDSQIFIDNKRVHFRNLKKKFGDIEFEQMVFFDNQMNNIRDVSELGVHCVYCPDGMTELIWEKGMKSFEGKNK